MGLNPIFAKEKKEGKGKGKVRGERISEGGRKRSNGVERGRLSISEEKKKVDRERELREVRDGCGHMKSWRILQIVSKACLAKMGPLRWATVSAVEMASPF